ncbi:MAG: ribosome assembly factor SBDS [Nanoarchaeota archaeon]|nr:ribosome assembly factor SBDS [Nanoarchaeota archaeon]MBU1444787.1 ribosome assembly factor SBDS [Nanoarchaeota archaeon]MBU2420271.1 ribosome assembly factor SBDS [Nanoarchaeota archaeon]MBU2475036.1 ribosome assembly factor SBDS [Nanoarchaeota archaeon]MBU3941259.1 ribosome assembly factor SBDS [Nanoarchaeota archaeon]
MSDISESVLARISKKGKHFEILVNLEKAIDFKHGKVELDEVLVSDNIFKDSKKGSHASEEDMKTAFGTDDKMEVIAKIIKEGELQLTAEYKNNLREEKKKQVIQLIHRNAVDPKTGYPHPIERLEMAVDDIGIHFDEFKSAEDQMQEVLKKLREVLPISFEIRELSIRIPAQFGGQSFQIIKKYSKIMKEDWQTDGSLLVLIEIPAGMQNELFDKLNDLTHGQVESKIISKR